MSICRFQNKSSVCKCLILRGCHGGQEKSERIDCWPSWHDMFSSPHVCTLVDVSRSPRPHGGAGFPSWSANKPAALAFEAEPALGWPNTRPHTCRSPHAACRARYVSAGQRTGKNGKERIENTSVSLRGRRAALSCLQNENLYAYFFLGGGLSNNEWKEIRCTWDNLFG